MIFIEYKNFRQLVDAEYERRDLEFKEGFKWSQKSNISHIQARTIKGIIALSNLSLGGILIIGITQKEAKFELNGLTEEEYKTFKDYDRIKGLIDGYVYSNTSFEMEYTKDENDKYFIVFQVRGFEKYPLVCKKNLTIGTDKILEKDNIYVRTKASQCASDKAGNYEIEELIDSSVKKVASYWYNPVSESMDSQDKDKALFNNQFKDIRL